MSNKFRFCEIEVQTNENSKKMYKFRKTARICFDFLLLAAACFALYATQKWLEPFKRGFFCNDDSLKYPYKAETVNTKALIIITTSIPSVVILVVELFKHLEPAAAKEKSSENQCCIAKRLKHCCIQLGYYAFGLALTLTATEITKHAVGRFRPHFITVCQPEMLDGTNCAHEINEHRFIEDFTCGEIVSAQQLSHMRQSFPSGHSSSFFYAMLYTAIYLQATLSTRASKLLKHSLQFIFVMIAWYVALTRISDYMHHWTDVVAGALLGATFAFLTTIFVTKLFDSRHHQPYRMGKLPQVKPTAMSTMTAPGGATTSHQTTPTTAALPAYTFGNLPYLHYPHQYTQTYHNYGYVP